MTYRCDFGNSRGTAKVAPKPCFPQACCVSKMLDPLQQKKTRFALGFVQKQPGKGGVGLSNPLVVHSPYSQIFGGGLNITFWTGDAPSP